MLILCPFSFFSFISYIRSKRIPPITDEICWSLEIRWRGIQLYINQPGNGDDEAKVDETIAATKTIIGKVISNFVSTSFDSEENKVFSFSPLTNNKTFGQEH